ncbi:MAG TPA: GNAT family N-acetyltransferase, partial [Ktedonobacterales bacterium]|nr:GNAT family N-acetyltransferase [Ktedonobacterales bacterium]
NSNDIMASAVATAYGEIGVIGNVIVHASYRARGLGRAVMEAELEWLSARGVRSVELDATVDGRPLYQKLGFVERSPSWMLVETVGKVLAPGPHSPVADDVVTELTAADLKAVGQLDRQAFGGDRLPLLAAMQAQHGTRGWSMRDTGGAIAGYLFTRPTERQPVGVRVGPWVARTPEVALALLRYAVAATAQQAASVAAAPVLASVPGASGQVTATFARAGMPLVPDDVRMRLTLSADEAGASGMGEDWVFGMLAPMVG